MLHIYALLAQKKEREQISQRAQVVLAAAKASGTKPRLAYHREAPSAVAELFG